MFLFVRVHLSIVDFLAYKFPCPILPTTCIILISCHITMPNFNLLHEAGMFYGPFWSLSTFIIVCSITKEK